MSRAQDIREGMRVYGPDSQDWGTIERIHAGGFDAAGKHYSQHLIIRVEGDTVYVHGAGVAEGEAQLIAAQQEDEIRVPIAEERLAVGTREVELGEVQIRKTVETEEQTIPVTLRQEEVHIERIDVAERPATGEDLFEEGTIRVALRGEEAVVAKETIITGEVVVETDRVAEERQITDTVRRQRVEVEENYQQARTGFEQHFATNQAARVGGTGRAFSEAEPNYRTGFEAGRDERYAGREFEAIEPELRRDYATRGVTDDRWTELREEIREGWSKARGR